jgi:hypothetical protein
VCQFSALTGRLRSGHSKSRIKRLRGLRQPQYRLRVAASGSITTSKATT